MFAFWRKKEKKKSFVELCYEEMANNTFLYRDNILMWRENDRLTATVAMPGEDGTAEIDMDILRTWLVGSRKRLSKDERRYFAEEGIRYLREQGIEAKMITPLFDTLQHERRHRHF